MNDLPPCNIRDSWVIPRLQAWIVVLGLCGTMIGALASAYEFGQYVNEQKAQMRHVAEEIDAMKEQILSLYCDSPKGRGDDRRCKVDGRGGNHG